MTRRRRNHSKRQRPHLNASTTDLRVRLFQSDRILIERLADSRQVYLAAILRDALHVYLASPAIQAELKSADTPAVAVTAKHDAPPAQDAGGQDEEVAPAEI